MLEREATAQVESAASTMFYDAESREALAHHNGFTDSRVYRSPMSRTAEQASTAQRATNHSLTRPAKHTHHLHNTRICEEGICFMGLEREILRHPDAKVYAEALSLCFRLPIVLFESLRALREEGEWHNELRSIYGSLFAAPPADLFNMVSGLRGFPQFDPTKMVERLQKLRDNASPGERPAGRTAPEGQVYICPSENCKKPFKKSGHAQNHVEKRHPEYLQLHPDYQPQQFIVDDARSSSTSPILDRRACKKSQEQRPNSRHSSQAPRSARQDVEGLAVMMPESYEYQDLLSPSSFGISSIGDIDDQSNTYLRSRSNSRHSPQQPLTPQTQEPTFADIDTYKSNRHSGAVLSKRSRNANSSSESISMNFNGDGQVPRRHQYRQSKRLSMHYDTHG